ncbi:MAG: Fic family protein [Deltaproteobacteria bacterium]|nr:MAG: Fic family protein [Deltaproteobacteria bacterium]
MVDPLAHTPITPELLRTIGAIDEFKGRWQALGNLAPERLSALKRVATIESVGSSTRIEGVKLNDDEIARLLSGLDISSFRSRDEQEVAGYAKLMELIFESHGEIPLTENTIGQLHGILLEYSTKDDRHRGRYKTLSNNVEAFDPAGHSVGVIFETATPFDTPRRMETLVAWTNEALAELEHHPLLIIATFVVHFLAVHPFQDGNGRLSRALTTLLLLRSGYGYVPYASLEKIIEDSKDEYYVALRRAQGTLRDDEPELLGWLVFFVRALHRQKEILERKIAQERLMAPLAPLSEKLLGLVGEHGRITVREAAAVTGANRNTIKDHLSKLVTAKRLVRRGRARGTWYERA